MLRILRWCVRSQRYSKVTPPCLLLFLHNLWLLSRSFFLSAALFRGYFKAEKRVHVWTCFFFMITSSLLPPSLSFLNSHFFFSSALAVSGCGLELPCDVIPPPSLLFCLTTHRLSKTVLPEWLCSLDSWAVSLPDTPRLCQKNPAASNPLLPHHCSIPSAQ